MCLALGTVRDALLMRLEKVGQSSAHITFTGSENSLSLPSAARHTGVGGYNMTKHAMLSMADTFRFELADEDIGVSLAIPGGVLTDIMSSPAKRQDEFRWGRHAHDAEYGRRAPRARYTPQYQAKPGG